MPDLHKEGPDWPFCGGHIIHRGVDGWLRSAPLLFTALNFLPVTQTFLPQ